MIYTFFDNLRTKPKVVRDQYALFGAICFTLMIGGVWSLSLPARLSTVATSASSTNVASAASAASAPMSGFFDQLKSQFKGAKNTAVLPPATSTDSSSAVASAKAALGLQLTAENRQVAETPSSTIRFGTITIALAAKLTETTTTSTTTVTNTGQ